MKTIKKLKIVLIITVVSLIVFTTLVAIMLSIEHLEYTEMLEADKKDGSYKIKIESNRRTLSTVTLIDNKTGDDVSHLCKVEIWIPENDYEPHLIGIANKIEIDMHEEKTLNIIIDPDGESIWKTDFINFTCSMRNNYWFYVTIYRK